MRLGNLQGYFVHMDLFSSHRFYNSFRLQTQYKTSLHPRRTSEFAILLLNSAESNKR